MAYVSGIDVSYWEAGIDWKKVRGDGIRFVFIKATEGEQYVDPTFDDNWLGARSVGILRGAYHFFHPNMNPVKQAEKFLQVIRGMDDDGELPPVLDLEVTDNQSNQTILERAKAWLDRIQQNLGVAPIIYSNRGFLEFNFSVPGGGPPFWTRNHMLWIANYGQSEPSLPPGWLDWSFWQHSETGKVNGINASVDMDWFNGSVEELYRLAGEQLPGPRTYRVKQGDTLQSISDQFGVSLSELVSANAQLIQPNLNLNIPDPTTPSTRTTTEVAPEPGPAGRDSDGSAASPRTYTVRSGDTLSGIALKYGTNYGAIAQLNGIAPPYLVVPGQVLKIP